MNEDKWEELRRNAEKSQRCAKRAVRWAIVALVCGSLVVVLNVLRISGVIK